MNALSVEYRADSANKQNAAEGYIGRELPFIDKVASSSWDEINDANQRAIEEMRRDAAGAWQERVFGKDVDIELLRSDVVSHFERPITDRQGQAFVIDGVEKRPIVNIALGDSVKLEVEQQLLHRHDAVVAMIDQLTERVVANESMSETECDELLYVAGVRERAHGNLLGRNDSPGATVADLYVDEADLQLYDKLDALCNQLTNASGKYTTDYDSRKMFTNAVLQFSAYTFPSGVELHHAIRPETLKDIVDHGGIAPRSQRKHGHTVDNGSLNGGFIHMTSPGGVATEYGSKLVAGIPIDTIVKHSPYMQLEPDYTGNQFLAEDSDGEIKAHSTQYKMGEIRINSLDGAPEVFWRSLKARQDGISAGLQHVNIGQGAYDNLSFAAGGTAETAGAYEYPIEELSLYGSVDIADDIIRAADNDPTKEGVLAEVMRVAYVAEGATGGGRDMYGGVLRAHELPNFDLSKDGGVTVFVPISSRSVEFTESGVGNRKNESLLPFTLDTIMADKLPNYLDGLIADGMPPAEAVSACIDAVNQKGARLDDLVYSYNGGSEELKANGILFDDVLNRISDAIIQQQGAGSLGLIENLREEPPEKNETGDKSMQKVYDSWSYQGRSFATRGSKEQMIQAYAKRMFDASPSDFYHNVDTFKQYGYVLTEAQHIEAQRIKDEIASQAAQQTWEVPALGDGFTF